MALRVVIDTNVWIAAMRSRNGASFRLLESVDSGEYVPVLSVPLILEHEAVLKRQSRQLGLTHAEVDVVLDYLCGVGEHRRIFFLWRPVLRDPQDDLVLELAVEAGAVGIVTFNTRDFGPAAEFGLKVWTPGQFLEALRR